MPSTSPAVSAPTSRDHDDPVLGHERRAARRVQQRRDRGVAPVGAGGCVGLVARTGAAGDGDLLEREACGRRRRAARSTSVVDDPVAQRGVGALDEVGRRRAPLHGIAAALRPCGTPPPNRRRRAPARCGSRGRRRTRPTPATPRAGRRCRARAARRGTACSTTTAGACSRARRSASLSRSSTALCAGVLPRSRPASSAICSGAEPGGLGPRGAVEQERGDVAEQVVVVRLGIGDARLAAGCGWRRPTRRGVAATAR